MTDMTDLFQGDETNIHVYFAVGLLNNNGFIKKDCFPFP